MAAFLVDECCPRAIAETLRGEGHDVRYAAETDRRVDDVELVRLAQAEARILVTEDFDSGELLIRDRLPAPGAVIIFLPDAAPEERARRLLAALGTDGFVADGRLTIISARRIRQRALP